MSVSFWNFCVDGRSFQKHYQPMMIAIIIQLLLCPGLYMFLSHLVFSTPLCDSYFSCVQEVSHCPFIFPWQTRKAVPQNELQMKFLAAFKGKLDWVKNNSKHLLYVGTILSVLLIIFI